MGALLLLAGSCSDDEPPSSAGIGPEGGTLVLPDGARIELPPGAVPDGVKVVASLVNVKDAAAPPEGMRVSSKVYAFTPHGTRFAKPVTIQIPASSVENSVFELDDDEDTSWEQTTSTRGDKGFHAITVEHISLFAELEALEGAGGFGGASGAAGVGGDDANAGSGGFASLGGAASGGEAAGGEAGAAPVLNVAPRRMCVGSSHGCAIVDDGQITCWGAGHSGQLGDGVVYDEAPFGRPSAALVPDIDNAVQLSCQGETVTALLADGSVIGWGRADLGQLGDGTDTEQTAVPSPSSLTNAKQISSSGQHVCALLEDETVSCWGRKDFGQLGDGAATEVGTGTYVSTPQPVPGLSGVLEIETGGYHTCAVLADRTLKCWGDNGYGQLGVASPVISSTPLAVPGLADVVHLALGVDFSCALLGSGAVSCWGQGGFGQLGDGVARVPDTASSSTSTPVSVLGASDTQWVGASYGHACLIDGDGRARCWGSGGTGQLGNGSFYTASPYCAYSPEPVSMLEGVEDLAVGTDSTCARLHDQSLWCWGYGVYGALGSGVVYPIPEPIQIPPIPIDELGSAVPVRVITAP